MIAPYPGASQCNTYAAPATIADGRSRSLRPLGVLEAGCHAAQIEMVSIDGAAYPCGLEACERGICGHGRRSVRPPPPRARTAFSIST